MSITSVKPNPQDVLAQMGPNVYRAAYEQGLSLSAHLENEMPSGEFKDGLDAFERLLFVAGIRTRNMPQYGVYSDRFESFHKNDNTRALVPEWMSRIWRRVATGRSVNTRGLYASDDATLGSLDHPYYDDAVAHWTSQVSAAIPLSEIIATEQPIDGDAYRAYYLTPVTAQQRMARIAEGAPIPMFKLTGGDHQVRLYKFGGGIEASYEVLRRQRIDRIAMHIARIAVQAEVDKVAAVIDVLLNGDGNTGTAATNYNLTTLDSTTTANNLTLKAWLAFKMKFANPYMLTHVLVQEDVALKLFMLNTGSGNALLATVAQEAGFNTFTPINPGLRDGVRMGWTGDAPSAKILAFDKRFAIERVFEIGASISEVEQYARNQTQILTMTEIEGYVKFDASAALTMNLAA